ncbi:IclR family transcriptional regulator [Natronolimnobius sp. AArcel1]|uniref:IclR family transcriptional regulator n=1 Tax=Natronolimnobius sp. AArcel1 TaxID=1679093 RepID=UPI0013ED35F8|nr:IclR family transcriptional regulator [Natronolimnobius sp. AArcel1]NGM67944.1 IclR family transcriptional regulator [Natronolimnobius sp. AArcel1]
MNDQRSGSETGKTIKSIETMLEILESIRRREEAGVTEIASDIGMSKSTAHHYVKTLELYNCLEKTNGRYRLGLQFLTYGGQARAGQRLYQLAKNDVDRLAAETGEEVRLAVEQRGRGITLYQSTGAHVDQARSYVGQVEELHCTAAGKAFLAALPAQRVEALLDDLELRAFTPETIMDRDELVAELEEIRARDVAFDDEERHEGVRCVAVSITNRSDELLGAISVSGPTSRLTGDRFSTTIPNQLQNIVGVVEVNTTYSEWEENVPQ